MADEYPLQAAVTSGQLRRADLIDFAPLIRRVARLDPAAAVRVRRHDDRVAVYVALPSAALVGRTISVGSGSSGAPDVLEARVDRTIRAGDLLRWLVADQVEPAGADAAWSGALPPSRGWRRVDTVPAAVVRGLVRQGADAHRQVAAAALSARAAQTLLETPVLTITGAGLRAELSNRELAALISMAFLPEDGTVVVARNGRWTRAAAQFGSVFAEDPRGGLTLL